ncbi:DUF983 domain-containing protein [Caulobacter sp. LjRoot300]|uniref:DUF983 domain-containing protein n=1 Tax=Caulobacter sp. LjRoot300 TaxID=3342321 RepID=UPI003ECCE825
MGLKRGARGRCPDCGEGRLFTAYLKIRPTCEVCGHNNGQYPADDAPPYFTILIVGHLVVAPLLAFPFIWQWPAAVVVAILIPSLVVLSLVLLPIVKGAVVGVLWAIAKPAEGRAQLPTEAQIRLAAPPQDPSLDIQ